MWSRWWETWSWSHWLGSVLACTPPCTISSAACPSLTSVSPLSLPQMLVSFVTERNAISYPACVTQLFFFLVFVISECHMLAVMAYDRYVAICNPLLYNVTMSYQLCSCMVVGVYIMGLTGATAHTGCMLRVLFCKADVINHYLCDLFPLLELSCSTTYINELFCVSVHLISSLQSWPSSAPTSSSSQASSKSTPRRAGPKPSAHAAPTSQLSLFSMDLQRSCTCSHHQSAPWNKGKCPLCFTPLLCPCWMPWSTAWGITMSKLPLIKSLKIKFPVKKSILPWKKFMISWESLVRK